ncbi:MAG: SET domain-containing protein-lysine N-methyltransferase [Bacteroidia bacterium]|nr:SET domain-containing protein-lysine N-methyltransferase [Bacteroidia bacterium]
MPKPLLKKRDYIEKNLEIKKSQIPGAGKGLYTKIAIERETIISEFTGEKISHTIALARFILKESHSLLYLNQKYSIDSLKDENCLSSYINDANGLVKVSNLHNNVMLVVSRGRLFVIAKRKIKAGEELFLSYGKGYWKTVKHYKIF